MEKIKLIIIYAVAMYLIGCFMSADFNIIDWDPILRTAIGLIYMLMLVMFKNEDIK